MFSYLPFCTLIISFSTAYASQPFTVPTYKATSANGKNSSARGWNSFGLQANGGTHGAAKWDFNDYHFQDQCQYIVTAPGYDYYCSIDSGWSLNGGDQYGRIVPDNQNIFSTTGSLQKFADWAHAKGLKVGVYLLPGALQADTDKTIEETSIKLGEVLDQTWNPAYSLRLPFKDWNADGVQQWHDSVVRNLASMSVDSPPPPME